MTDLETSVPLDYLGHEIVNNLVEDTIYSLTNDEYYPASLVNIIHEYADTFDPRTHFQYVLEDLIRVTHCHTCGKKKNVCFFGYVGEHCEKKCMKIYDRHGEYYDTTSEDYQQESDRLPHSAVPCGWCENYRMSLANTTYHSTYYNGQIASGYCWPMLSYHLACENECIRTRPVIKIPRYNS